MATTRPRPAEVAQRETYEPLPRRPELIWCGRERRRVAEPVPAQTLEIVRPRQETIAARGTSAPQLQWEDAAPAENRLIWTNDNLSRIIHACPGGPSERGALARSSLVGLLQIGHNTVRAVFP
jgi:hypothetical protein